MRRSRSLREAMAAGQPKSVGLVGNCAEVLPELVRRGVVPDMLTDQTSAHDPLNGYIPAGHTVAASGRAAGARSASSTWSASLDSMATHVRAMLDLQRAGAVTFDYGNNIRRFAADRGVTDAFRIPGFVPEYIRPLFCEGRGPFRWVALSGEPSDIAATDQADLPVVSVEPDADAAGFRWRNRRCIFRVCPRASAGWVTASVRNLRWK